MIGHLETIAGILRVFPDGQRYGDPYTWCATVRFLSRDTVEICGALRAPMPSEWRAIREALAAAGVTSAVIVRRRADGSEETHTVELKRP
jgi:hypothetical protein